MGAWQPSMEKDYGQPWKRATYLQVMQCQLRWLLPPKIPDTDGMSLPSACIHQVFTRERERERESLGSLTGICPGQATRLRALFYGLKHLSLHIRDKVHVAVFQHSIWKHWSFSAAHEKFPDLSKGLEHEDFDQVRLLLFDKQEADSNQNRKAFQKDTQAKAVQKRFWIFNDT